MTAVPDKLTETPDWAPGGGFKWMFSTISSARSASAEVWSSMVSSQAIIACVRSSRPTIPGRRLIPRHPPMLTLNAARHEAQWLDCSLRFLPEANPTPEVVARLSELFLAQAIRDSVEHLPEGSGGWLRGLADPAVARALSMI